MRALVVDGKRDDLSGKLEKAVAQAVEARGESEAALKLASEVEGALSVPEGLTGDAWLFLYRPTEGPPGEPAFPVFVTAVSA